MPLSGQPSRVSSIPPATVRFNPLIDTMAQSAWGQGKLEQLQSSCAQKDFLRLVHLEKVPSSESSEAVKQLFCNGNNAGPLLSFFEMACLGPSPVESRQWVLSRLKQLGTILCRNLFSKRRITSELCLQCNYVFDFAIVAC